jgi:hypothetical protein
MCLDPQHFLKKGNAFFKVIDRDADVMDSFYHFMKCSLYLLSLSLEGRG